MCNCPESLSLLIFINIYGKQMFGRLIFCFDFYIFCLYCLYLFEQGFKRLKKHQTGGRCGPTMPSEHCRTDESNRSLTSREAPGSVSKDRLSRGGTIPISIKFKKLGNEEATSRQREHYRVDRFQYDAGKSTRVPTPIEIGPKRLKVRGPIIHS